MSVEDNKKLVRRYYEDAPHNPDACDMTDYGCGNNLAFCLKSKKP